MRGGDWLNSQVERPGMRGTWLSTSGRIHSHKNVEILPNRLPYVDSAGVIFVILSGRQELGYCGHDNS